LCIVGGVAAENDAVAKLAWSYAEWLEEFVLHGMFSSLFWYALF